LLALISLVALAEPSPARLCADAAAGTEIEVCLRLAAEHPDAIDEIRAALVAHVDRTEADDRQLLEHLLALTGPRGAEAAAALADLGDPRAVPALLQAARSREGPVAGASTRALARWPEVWPVLGRWLVDPEVPEAVQEAARSALIAADDPRASALVDQAARRRDGRGEFWLATGAGAGLGYAMAAASWFGRTELWPVGAITGATAGASFGWVYGRAWPMDEGDAAFLAISGAGGAAAGAMIGAGLAEADGAAAGGLVGEAVGFGAAALLRVPHRGTAADTVEAAAFAALAAGATEGILRASGAAEPRVLYDGAVLGGALVLGHAVAPRVALGREDAGLVATTVTAGVAAGLLWPGAGDERVPLTLGAGAAGGALGLALAGPIDWPGDVWSAALTGGGLGAAIGGGAGLLGAPEDPRAAGAAAMALGAAGAGLGGWVGHVDPDPIDDRDVVLGVAATGWAGAQAAALGTALGARDEQVAGAVLLASGVAGLGAASLNLELDVPVPHTLSASSIGLWGAYAGGALGDVAGVDPRLTGVVGANLGLFTGGVLVSDVIGVPPLVIGIADAGGVLGASAAGVVSGWFSEDVDAVVLASLGGAAVGAAGGAALGTAWHRSGTRTDVARLHLPGRWSVAPMPSGVLVRVDGW
jgi:hypothetical protein